jgi:transcriptional regulator with XRE-family HTH domain
VVVVLRRAIVALPVVARDTADVENGLGARIRRARLLAGLSQEDLAAKLGVSLRTVGTWERKGTVPPARIPDLPAAFGSHWGAAAAADEAPEQPADPHVLTIEWSDWRMDLHSPDGAPPELIEKVQLQLIESAMKAWREAGLEEGGQGQADSG